MRDVKSLISFAEQLAKRQKELELQRTLKKEKTKAKKQRHENRY